jgi:hypothetical protein
LQQEFMKVGPRLCGSQRNAAKKRVNSSKF